MFTLQDLLPTFLKDIVIKPERETTMSIELKIKSKHLGLEAQVIRHEENKLKKQIRWQSKNGTADSHMVSQYQSIHNHRVWDVRNENRATFLARAYLEGKEYQTVEPKTSIHGRQVLALYVLPRVFEMVNKYGPMKDRISKRYDSKVGYSRYSDNEYKERLARIKAWADL